MNLLKTYYSGKLLIVSPKTTYQENKSFIQSFTQTQKNTFSYIELPDFSVLPDYHPSEQGHQQIANNVYTYLLNNKLIPCEN